MNTSTARALGISGVKKLELKADRENGVIHTTRAIREHQKDAGFSTLPPKLATYLRSQVSYGVRGPSNVTYRSIPPSARRLRLSIDGSSLSDLYDLTMYTIRRPCTDSYPFFKHGRRCYK